MGDYPFDAPPFDGPPPNEPPMGEEFSSQESGPTPAEPPAMPRNCELEMLRQLLLFPDLRLRFEELAGWALTEIMSELLKALARPAETEKSRDTTDNGTEDDEVEETERSVGEVVAKYVPDVRWVKALGAVEPACEEGSEDLKARAVKTYDDVEFDLKRRFYDDRIAEETALIIQGEREGSNVDEHVRKRMHWMSLKRKLMERR